MATSCGVSRRHGPNLTFLWIWCRQAAAALIGPLAWELPYAVGVALKKKKKRRLNPNVHCGVWVMMKQPCRFIRCNKCTPLVGELRMGDAMPAWGQEYMGNSLPSAVNLKLL